MTLNVIMNPSYCMLKHVINHRYFLCILSQRGSCTEKENLENGVPIEMLMGSTESRKGVSLGKVVFGELERLVMNL